MKEKVVLATTHIDRHFMKITKEALEDAAEELNAGRRLPATIEHDLTLPPFGKTLKAWVEPREDGEHQLIVEREIFDDLLWAELDDGVKLFKQESKTDKYPFVDRYSEMTEDVFLAYDWVNFDSKEDIKSFINDVKDQSQVEFKTDIFGRKSLIPDPEFIIGIAKVIGAYLITKNVLSKVGDKVLELAAEDIAKFYTFSKAVIGSAMRYARPKGRPITYVFVARGNPTLEFIARSSNADLVISAISLEKLEAALSEANFYYSALGAVKIQYLLSSEGKWEFNYLLTGTGAVIGTEKSLSRRAERFELLIQQLNANTGSDQEQENSTKLGENPAEQSTRGEYMENNVSATSINSEWQRLHHDFEVQANQYHELTLSVYFLIKDHPYENETFERPNHVVMLWQYFGNLESDSSADEPINIHPTKYGVNDAKVTAFAVIAGPQTKLFRRMAYRAGSLIPKEIRDDISIRIMENVIDPDLPGKPIFVANSDPLSVWLNFILIFISTFQPERFRQQTLDVDPFAASLVVLDSLIENENKHKSGASILNMSNIEERHYKVALSFPGERREYVSKIAEGLADRLGKDAVFYDDYYVAYLAMPNLDTRLLKIYHECSDLVVVFICEEYEKKEWCGLEWRAIRDLIKQRRDEDIMLMRFDDSKVKGLLSIDGYVDLRKRSPDEVVDLICQRLEIKNNRTP
ncbi:MAG: TIR domain-containing protein [Pyrinomonadaceae bacterium]